MRTSRGLLLVVAVTAGTIGCGGGGGGGGRGPIVVPPGSSFDAAFVLTMGTSAAPPPAIPGILPSRSSSVFYAGTLLKGVRYVAFTETNGAFYNDGSILDTVVTVWDSSQRAIAQSDDTWPRFGTDSQVYFEVPADGVYYVSVQDCSTALPAAWCAAGPVTDLAYTLYFTPVGTWYETNASPANTGSLANAQTIGFWVPAGQPAGHYAASVVDGNIPTVAGASVFKFTVPVDTYVTPGQRPRVDFFVQPIGTSDGNGSTCPVVVSISDGTTEFAWADQRNYGTGDDPVRGPLDLSIPVTLGKQYQLSVVGGAMTSNPATDYYFIQTEIGSFYAGLREAEGPTGWGQNDTPATAQRLGTIAGLPGFFAVDGDIVTTVARPTPATDVDWFEIDPPALTTAASLWCVSARSGSGVIGLAAQLYDASTATTTLLGTWGPESATSDLFSSFPAQATARSFLKVSASYLDLNPSGSDYRCSVQFTPSAGIDWWLHDNFATFPNADWQVSSGGPSVDAGHGNPAPSLLLPAAGAGIQSTASFPYSGGQWTFSFDVATDLSAYVNGDSTRVIAVGPGLQVTLPAFILDVSTGASPTTKVGCDYSATVPVTSDSGWHHVAIHVDWTAGTYACTWDGAPVGSGTAYTSSSSPNFSIVSSGVGIPVRLDNVLVLQGQ